MSAIVPALALMCNTILTEFELKHKIGPHTSHSPFHKDCISPSALAKWQ